MQISPILYTNQTYYNKPRKKDSVSFCSNPKSHFLEFTFNDFFVNIKGYGKDQHWARNVRQLADKATEKIKTSETSDEVLIYIADGIRNANNSCFDIRKKEHSGILRTTRTGYGKAGNWRGQKIITKITNQYKSYEDKLMPIYYKPLKNPFNDISLTKVEYDKHNVNIELVHGDDTKINNALDRVGGKFFNLKKDYISNPDNVTKNTLPEINSDVAEIRWIMAHSMPWERGSDAISNVFMRSLYKSMGIKTYPIKEGISLDMEAFCTPLGDYKKNFTNYFEIEPNVMF